MAELLSGMNDVLRVLPRDEVEALKATLAGSLFELNILRLFNF